MCKVIGKTIKRKIVIVGIVFVFLMLLIVPTSAAQPNGNDIYIYSYNEEFEERVNTFFLTKYPQYKDQIHFVTVNSTGKTYAKIISKKLKRKSQQPTIIVYEKPELSRCIKSKQYMTLDKVGITAGSYKNAFDYTKELGTVNGKLKAVTWQVTPGCFMYNRKIAKEVFGTDNPTKIQELVKDWDSFIVTAEKLNQFGYNMLYSPDVLMKAFKDKKTNNYKRVNTALEAYYTDPNSTMWTSGWLYELCGYTDPNTFGQFATNWFLPYCFENKGAYNICEGPAEFYWGGQFLVVNSKCQNKELVELILKTICTDTNTMKDIGTMSGDVPNHKVSLMQMKKNPYKTSNLRKQNQKSVFYNSLTMHRKK